MGDIHTLQFVCPIFKQLQIQYGYQSVQIYVDRRAQISTRVACKKK